MVVWNYIFGYFPVINIHIKPITQCCRAVDHSVIPLKVPKELYNIWWIFFLSRHATLNRKMLTRLWSALTSGLKTEDLASLHVCQWQTHKKVLLLYLLWRWICAIVCLAIIVCSSIDIGREKSGEKFEHHYEKWWIYLTNWTVLCCVVQAWLAALICTKALMDNNRDFGETNEIWVWRKLWKLTNWQPFTAEVVLQTKVGFIQQFYWITYSIATVYSFIV